MEPDNVEHGRTLREGAANWWHISNKKHTVLGLGLAIVGLLGFCLLSGTRPPEQIETVKQVEVIKPDTEIRSVQLKKGQNLFTVTDAAGMPKLEALELNMPAVEAHTAWCDARDTLAKRTTGICRRVDIAGHRNMAPDGWRPGQWVNYRAKATLASNGK